MCGFCPARVDRGNRLLEEVIIAVFDLQKNAHLLTRYPKFYSPKEMINIGSRLQSVRLERATAYYEQIIYAVGPSSVTSQSRIFFSTFARRSTNKRNSNILVFFRNTQIICKQCQTNSNTNLNLSRICWIKNEATYIYFSFILNFK